MRKLAMCAVAAAGAALAGCATAPAPAPIPVANANPCGTGYVDVNNDGSISGSEWNTWRSGAYGYWDVDKDGRVSRSEFENCWRAGGFYREAYYDPTHWNQYWTSFDANGDGYLSNDEYWSTGAWSRIDRNANGVVDSNEWVWWGS